MIKKRKDVEKALKKKGFVEKLDGHHKYYILYENGNRTNINTHTSHGSTHKDINVTIYVKMAKQMKLTKSELDQFVKCTLSKDNYVKLLKNKNLL